MRGREPVNRSSMTSGGRRLNWNREETILAADVYANQLGRRLPSNDEHPTIVALSQLLRAGPWHPADQRKESFRNPAGVYLKLANLLSVDPDRPQKGMSAASAMDRSVMQEFYGQWGALANEAARIRASIGTKPDTVPEVAEAPEVADAVEAVARRAGKKRGQGLQVSVEHRLAVERAAMERAVAWLVREG